jgi:hypothetical protein
MYSTIDLEPQITNRGSLALCFEKACQLSAFAFSQRPAGFFQKLLITLLVGRNSPTKNKNKLNLYFLHVRVAKFFRSAGRALISRHRASIANGMVRQLDCLLVAAKTTTKVRSSTKGQELATIA